MSFKNYLIEAVEKNEIVKKLFKECRPYIEELRKNKANHFFYRGSDKKTKDILKIKPRQDRVPKDMPPNVHEYIDDYFYRKFRWRPRSEGVFTSFRKTEAMNYGNPLLFFPIGKYDYVFSPDIEDLYGELDGKLIMDYVGVDDPPDYLGFDLEYEYNDKYGEGTDGGTWYYEGTDTNEITKTDAMNVAAESEGIDIEDEDAYYALEDRLEWMPDMTYEDFVDEVWIDKVREAENELNSMLGTYVQSKRMRDAADDGYGAPEVMWRCDNYYIVNPEYEQFLIDNLLQTNVKDFKNTINRIDKQMLLPFKWSKKR